MTDAVNPTCNYAGLSDQLNIGKINQMVQSTSTRANKALDEYEAQLDAHNKLAKQKIGDSSYTKQKYTNTAKQKLKELQDKQSELMGRLMTVYDSYVTQLKGTKSILELNKERTEEHRKLQRKLENTTGDVTTYDRKAHYEYNQNQYISIVKDLLVDNFWIFIAMLSLAVYYRYQFSNKKYFAYIILFALCPLLIKYVLLGFIIFVYNYLKSAYFDL